MESAIKHTPDDRDGIPCCTECELHELDYGNNAYREKDNTRVYNRSLRYLRMNA